MSTIDIVIGVILILGFIRGFMRGLIIEIASLIALVAGIYGAIHFSHFTLEFLKDYVSWEDKYIELCAYAVTFIIIVVSILLIGKLLTKLAGAIALGIVNRICGGLFGILKLAFVISVVMMFLGNMNNDYQLIDEEHIDKSILYQPVSQIAPLILPPLMQEIDKQKES
ncbi:membrane protein required for colicin V production [Mesonia phycicola]|uniref:Membrane protein required for colicin V production n=1 Tax=Mesonia phycicola TaxID=579105 RepID=A0A1M6CUD1_9FLAO|nr:CvpA family protein [Mesonia phycicola]SHI64503.1 membrane protein required for colicin V production [Mesonia phycicola]